MKTINEYKSLNLGDIFLVATTGDDPGPSEEAEEGRLVALLVVCIDLEHTLEGQKRKKSDKSVPRILFSALDFSTYSLFNEDEVSEGIEVAYDKDTKTLRWTCSLNPEKVLFISPSEIISAYSTYNYNPGYYNLWSASNQAGLLSSAKVIKVGRLKDMSKWPHEAIQIWATEQLRLCGEFLPKNLSRCVSPLLKRKWIIEASFCHLLQNGKRRKDVKNILARKKNLIFQDSPGDGPEPVLEDAPIHLRLHKALRAQAVEEAVEEEVVREEGDAIAEEVPQAESPPVDAEPNEPVLAANTYYYDARGRRRQIEEPVVREEGDAIAENPCAAWSTYTTAMPAYAYGRTYVGKTTYISHDDFEYHHQGQGIVTGRIERIDNTTSEEMNDTGSEEMDDTDH